MRFLAALAAPALAFAPASAGSGVEAAAAQRPEAAGAEDAELEQRRLARDRSAAEARIRYRLQDAHTASALGVDMAGSLAEMLVPNIRPVPIWRDARGLPNEVDLAEGSETAADWVAGTRFERLSEANFAAVRQWRGETFGPACNAEFRSRFAAHLRRTLGGARLRRAYVFLAARTPYWRGDPVPLQPVAHWSEGRPMIARLVAFDGEGRRPPVRWSAEYEAIEQEIVRWTDRDRTGRALQRSADAFWRANAASLDAAERACPAAAARWPSVQARIVAPVGEAAERRR